MLASSALETMDLHWETCSVVAQHVDCPVDAAAAAAVVVAAVEAIVAVASDTFAWFGPKKCSFVAIGGSVAGPVDYTFEVVTS